MFSATKKLREQLTLKGFEAINFSIVIFILLLSSQVQAKDRMELGLSKDKFYQDSFKQWSADRTAKKNDTNSIKINLFEVSFQKKVPHHYYLEPPVLQAPERPSMKFNLLIKGYSLIEGNNIRTEYGSFSRHSNRSFRKPILLIGFEQSF